MKSSSGILARKRIDGCRLSGLERLVSKGEFCPEVEEFVENLTGQAWRLSSTKVRARVVELCFNYWRIKGFPYFEMSNTEIRREYSRLSRTTKSSILFNNEIQISSVGLGMANLFHPKMWEVPVKRAYTPVDRFFDDKSLRRLIAHALKIWPNRRSVNRINLRGMLRTFSKTTRVSNFRPTAAKAIIEEFSKDGETVLDFSAGYGGRLLGCLSLRRKYIGIDPCKNQVRGLREMNRKLSKTVETLANAKVIRGCAEDLLPGFESNSIDLIFSSPPYFDLERYSLEKTQSYLRYPHYDEWRISFFRAVVLESHRILKPGGNFIINLPHSNAFPLVEDLHRFSEGLFRLVKTLRLRLGHKPYLRSLSGLTHKYEPIFVLTKGGTV